MSTITIYPTFDAVFYSFYIQGLIEVFGPSNIHFSSRPFPSLPSVCLAFILRGQRELRVVIDAYDGAMITNHIGLEWCEVYGKVNLAWQLIPKEHAHKCLPIGPSFAVQVWSPVKSWWVALRNYRVCVDYRLSSVEINSSFKHFANYRSQYKYRLPVSCFVPGLSRDNYIFFLSTLWKEEGAPRTSEYRALFIESCRSLAGVTFEGGLVPSPSWSMQNLGRFANYIAPRLVPLPEWLEKIKSSACVFNTPAVWSSHTWKLAEFLALGKAIISTPLARELPTPLLHGHHIHYVDGSLDSIRGAIDLLLNDHDYRKHLERNAYDYYSSFLSPKRVIERLLGLC
jgi:glycosyltransferase involved in cell wall biosynthesis